MKIEVRTLTEEAAEANDYQQIFELVVNGENEISANDYGEPEDNTLSRDLNFVYGIPNLIRKAYWKRLALDKLFIWV